MVERIEDTMLRNLLCNEDYYRKVIPHIDPSYFEQHEDRLIFEEICDFSAKYDKIPTKEILTINLAQRHDLTEEIYQNTCTKIKEFSEEHVDQDWLVDSTEKWCQDRAIYLALMESIKIADGGHKELSKDAIPSILQKALGVSFDEHIGHDYIESADDRFAFYHKDEKKIPFDLDKFNKITKGGLPNKTLNIALAGTGVGKSLFMCHCAGSALMQGYNVLYITLEMAEEKIAERIDANCMNVNIKDLEDLPQVIFRSKIDELSKKTKGKLIIKEYPTASAHAGHFRALLSELSLKKAFRPDIIFIDYLNICASSRYKGHIVNSYTYVKAIAEELRGLAVEFDLPIVSATQTTRSGFGSTDVDLTDTSESFGLPATADLMFALMSAEELEQSGRIAVKQLKNRYNDLNFNKKFLLGIDRAKMKLFDVAEEAQDIIKDVEEEDVADAFDQIKQNQARLCKFAEWKI